MHKIYLIIMLSFISKSIFIVNRIDVEHSINNNNAEKRINITKCIPPEAGQGWNLELFELAEPIPAHYHKIQRQLILIVEGEMQASYENEESVELKAGNLIYIKPGIIHSLIPKGTVRFFAIDLPGISFPEDVFYDEPMAVSKWTPSTTRFLPSLDPKYFRSKIDLGDYVVYELIPGSETEKKWSTALLEIQDSPKHFHRIERELFIVVNGELDIEINGIHHMLAAGEFIEISPGNIHHLKSATKKPVQVLCFNFPAFDPADMHCIETNQ